MSAAVAGPEAAKQRTVVLWRAVVLDAGVVDRERGILFTSILTDPSLLRTCPIIDALDECIEALDLLLDLVIRTSSAYNGCQVDRIESELAEH